MISKESIIEKIYPSENLVCPLFAFYDRKRIPRYGE
jgi:hypothetical protein